MITSAPPRRRWTSIAAVVTLAAALLVVPIISGGASAEATPVLVNSLRQVFTPDGNCYDEYQVPAGETELDIDAIGAAGQDGSSARQNASDNGDVVPGGAGGEGSEVNAIVRVTPGSWLYVSPDSSLFPGIIGGFPGQVSGLQVTLTGTGGRGGNASAVTSARPNGCSNQAVNDADVLVVAAGGGGGGGASTDSDHDGGYGANESQATGNAGGDNSSHDGAGGSTATQWDPGAGGAGGNGYQLGGFPAGTITNCLPASDGHDGTSHWGGEGGSGPADPTPVANCGGFIDGALSSGGGGGGGGGIFGGGGGGGGDDHLGGAGGGGGGAGSSYVAQQIASPTPTSDGPKITITPVEVAPAFTSSGYNMTCTVTTYCSETFTATGFPLPQLGDDDTNNWPEGLTLVDNGDGTATLSGTVPARAVGTYSYSKFVAINSGGTATAAPFTITATLGPLSSVSLSSPFPSVIPVGGSGQTYDFGLTAHYATGYQTSVSDLATWSSTNITVGTMNGKTFTPVHAGTTTITGHYGGKTDSQLVTVSAGIPTSLAVSAASSTVGLGNTDQLTATAHYSDGTSADLTSQVVWSVDNPGATVDANGLVTGTATTDRTQVQLRATLLQNGNPVSTGTTTVTVSLASPNSVTVTPATATIPAQGSEQYTATGNYNGGRTADLTGLATWSTSNTAIASFSSGGLVQTPLHQEGGTVTVTATEGAVAGTASLTVLPGQPDRIDVTPHSSTLGLGTSEQLTAIATYPDGTTVDITSAMDWSTDGSGTLQVSSGGLVTAVGTGASVGGTGTIRSDYAGTPANSINVTVTLAHPVSVSISPQNPTVPQGGSQLFTALGTYPGGYQADITPLATFTSSDPSVGVIHSGNELDTNTTTGGGHTTVTVTAPDGVATASTVATEMLGNPVSLAVTPQTPTVGAGATQQFTAIATYRDGSTLDVTDNVTWTSSAPSVATVSSTGLATVLSHTSLAGSYITGTLAFSGGSVSAGTNLTVSLLHPTSITVTPATVTLIPSATQDYTAIGTYPDGGTADITNLVTWSSSNTALAYFNGNELRAVFGTPPGSVTVTASLGGATGTARADESGAVAVTGPSSATTPALAAYTSGTFTASGGSGSYTWTLTNAPAGLALSATTGSSVTITGTPTTAATTAVTLKAVDTTATIDSTTTAFSLTVTALPQVITFTAPSPNAVTGTHVTLSAAGGAGSKPVVFSVDSAGTSGACSITGTTLSFSKVGTCIVDASQAADSAYAAAATVSYSISVLTAQSLYWVNGAPSSVAVNGAEYTALALDNATNHGGVTSIDAATTNSACKLVDAYDVAFQHVGTCVIDGNEPGTSTAASAPQIQLTITVTGLAESLRFASTAPTTAVAGGSTYTPTFTKGSSPSPVVVSVDASSSACTVTNNVVSFTHVGTCLLDANQAASGDYLAATQAQQSVTVRIGSQRITFGSAAPTAVAVGDVLTVAAGGGGSGNPVQFSVDSRSASGACEVDADSGTVIVDGPGLCTIDADQAGNTDFNAAPRVSQSFTAKALHLAVSTISATASSTPQTPFTVTLRDGNGNLAGRANATVVDLMVFDTYYNISSTATVSTTAGGTPISQAVIPAGSTSTTLYFGDTASGWPTIDAYDESGALDQATTLETVVAGPATALTFAQGPTDTAQGQAVSPAVQVGAVDTFGNPVSGLDVNLSVDHGSIDQDALEATDDSGLATFAGLTIDAVGTYLLTADAGSLQAGPSAFSVTAAAPDITGITPNVGTASGGTPVTITGDNLDTATAVLFAGTPATNWTIDSPTQITAVAPAHTSGAHKVVVITAGGSTPQPGASTFTYVKAPTVTALDSHFGSIAGNDVVTITGSQFGAASQVLFGTYPAQSFQVLSATQIVAVSPTQASGAHHVIVTNPAGSSRASAADLFTYAGRPVLSGISPASGGIGGGTAVVLTGHGFTDATSVSFGTSQASFQVISDTEIDAVTSGHGAAVVDTRVTTAAGTTTISAADHFTYLPAAAVSSVSPSGTATGGGTRVTIIGRAFDTASQVLFGTVPATSFEIVSSTEIIAVSPVQRVTRCHVRVLNPSGTSAATAADIVTVG
ncbi:IPT/TIG domain-containing protein [Jatrophihabitans sp.]|uniref:IPT/TIG domain-containing protein n=1 Tax=Jatrophihabitans sp. TaxID=1932789 RepID=UPI0030C73DC2|nr:hypothetical protein [Jatrophihabitans sp.]